MNKTMFSFNYLSNKISNFLNRQTEDIKKGGITIFFRKLYTAASLLIAIPLIFLVKIIRPLILIRFGCLPSSRIGHFSLNAELYLCERDIDMHGHRTLDVFFYDLPISNQQLKKMLERRLRVCSFVRPMYKLCHLLPGYKDHLISLLSTIDFQGLLSRTQLHFSFTREEELFGQEELKKLGVPQEVPFVCFHTRDSVYLESVFPQKDWSYHNFRNADIRNYIPAAEELVRRGYCTIRMGSIVKEAITTNTARIIDYALNRSDFMDIYLCAKSRFYLGVSSGPSSLPMIFRTPTVYVNYIPIGHIHFVAQDLFIPKKLWLRQKGRFMTFREILSSEAKKFQRSEQYEQNGIEVIENTPEEIAAVAVEMDERLKGKWQTTEENEELQRLFWSLYDPSKLREDFLSRIGTEFLRNNRELLE